MINQDHELSSLGKFSIFKNIVYKPCYIVLFLFCILHPLYNFVLSFNQPCHDRKFKNSAVSGCCYINLLTIVMALVKQFFSSIIGWGHYWKYAFLSGSSSGGKYLFTFFFWISLLFCYFLIWLRKQPDTFQSTYSIVLRKHASLALHFSFVSYKI